MSISNNNTMSSNSNNSSSNSNSSSSNNNNMSSSNNNNNNNNNNTRHSGGSNTASSCRTSGNKRDDANVVNTARTKKQKEDLWFPWNDAWTKETPSSMMFVGLEEATAAKFIHKHGVKTLGQLQLAIKDLTIFANLCVLLKLNIDDDAHRLINKFQTLVAGDDPESWLDNEILTDGGKVELGAVEERIFRADLTSIYDTRSGICKRNDGARFVPIIVSGSSGAGKTTFVRHILCRHLFQNDNKMFCVYMTRESAIPNGNWSKEQAAEKMAEQICLHIKKLLDEAYRRHEASTPHLLREASTPQSKRELLLIIDEIGIQDDKEFVGDSTKLNTIRKKVEKEIATTVQLVLAGTGADLVTSGVNSDIDSAKVVVKPWTVETIERLANNLGLEDQESLDLLKTPVLSELGSNARAAVFIINELKNSTSLSRSLGRHRSLIDKVVCEVACQYIHSNGLGSCTQEERRHVVKVVLTTLRNSKRGHASANIDCSFPKVRRVAIGLMDFHIKTENQKLLLRQGQQFAVTVSPAITIVLSALMGAIETFTGSWEGVERIGTLHALGDIYVDYPEPKTPEPPKIPHISLVRSASAFPATSGTVNYKAPCVDRNTVFLNGMGAPHADIVSKYRFWQFKKSKSDCAELDLQKELAKMGVMQNGWYEYEFKEKKKNLLSKTQKSKLTAEQERKIYNDTFLSSRWMTKKMIHYWNTESGNKAISDPQAEDLTTYVPSDAGNTRHLYPFNQLFQREDVREVNQWKSTMDDALKMVKQDKFWEDLPDNQKITVVFATNAAGFKLKGAKGIRICRNHVGDEGILTELNDLQTFVGNINGRIMLDLERVEIKFLIGK